MTRRFSPWRAAAMLVAGALLFVLAGDRGVTAVALGIDPLEVLDLQVKPNVIVFLDSSGTFKESPQESGGTPAWAGGDWPDSKLYQMKQVFRQLVQDNESKVSFMFGQFTQANSRLQNTAANTSTGNGGARFYYTTTSQASPSMTTTELTLTRADAADTTTRGQQSWQEIRGGWNTLYYRENTVTCAAPVTAQFYTTGAALATALQTSMNACGGRGGTPNRYYVTYNGGAGSFTFGRCAGANNPVAGCVAGGNVNFEIRWNDTPNNIAGALARAGAGNTGLNTVAVTSGGGYVLLRRDNGDDDTETVGTTPVTTYWLSANRFYNGETYDVLANGTLCGPRGVATPTSPPSVNLQLVPSCGAGPSVPAVTFTWAGGIFGGNTISCNGYQVKVPLVACNTQASQVALAAPIIEREAPLAASGLTLQGYTESQDGRFTTTSNPATLPGGITADGSTPLAPAMQQIAGIFNTLWTTGQNPGPPVLGPISGHLNPKEKTIVLLVTDASGNDATCSHGTENEMLLETAYWAQTLYDPIVGGVQTPSGYLTIGSDPGSSVTTYVIGFGRATSLLNWVAWGGSGMQRPTTTVNTGFPHWATSPTQADRDQCKTCVDAFIVPDAATLADTLQKIINQGASSGEFSAQQSLTDSIYELAGNAPQTTATYTAPAPWSPFNPRNRYDPLVPHRFVSTFSLPLFTGQIRAYTQDGPDSLASPDATCLAGAACRRWSGNDKLASRVSTGMAAACPVNAVAVVTGSQCTFSMLWNGADITNVGSRAGVGIRRRIFTTSQNGVFGPTVDQLIAGQSPFRVALWPPQTASIPRQVAPASNTAEGLFDAELGLPLDSASPLDQAFLDLRTTYKACMGSNLPASCPATTQLSGFTLAHMQRARREARETLLAFLAGATFLVDNGGDPKRVVGTSAPYTAGEVLYVARTSILAESTLATPAVVGPPQEELPEATQWKPEYELYRDGPRDHSNPAKEPDGVSAFTAGMVRSGFGLRNPDRDGNNTSIGTVQGRIFYANDARVMKPVMSVLYAGSNLALHAFRAGPNGAVTESITTPCDVNQATQEFAAKDCGGEELWAYLPYDQLGKLPKRFINNPQKRDPHDYSIARAVRFSDIFVPTPGTADDPDDTPVSKTVGGVSLGQIKGVWRKVLFVGRGKGGKYLTAIDVTSPGMFTDRALSDNIVGPVFLWSRGNPDTTNGAPTGTQSHDQADFDAYATMGETWSVPAVAFVDRNTMRADDATKKATATTRKPKGNDFVLYAGSGYGSVTGEGTSFYSIDPLTGDIITRVDVDAAAAASFPSIARSGMPFANALVANPVVFNASRYLYAPGGVASPNVAAAPARRVYIADLWGRQWKFLTAAPDKPLPVADLGTDQPVATANSLLGLPANSPNTKPYVYTTSGNENRVPVPATQFKNFGFRDDGSDTSLTVAPSVTQNGISVFPPMQSLFVIPFEPQFRGTVQPATAYSDTTGSSGQGRIFFGGTRFNAPNTPFAPPVPPFPCRSSFDSILYALGAQSGLAAYDLAYGNAYQIFQDSRIVAVSTQAAPGASLLAKDEGLAKTGQPIQPPPPMGLSPSTQATQNIVMVSGAGLPQPTVRFGSTVCQ